MLQIVILPSMESERMALPGTRSHDRCRPDSDAGDDPEDEVLGGDAVWQRAVEVIDIALGLLGEGLGGADVLDLEVPIPKASALKAPWVAVWLSPQTITIRVG